MKFLGAIAIVAASVLQACQGNVFELEVGDCFTAPSDAPGNAPIGDVEIAECDGGGDNEVFARFAIADQTWPGAAEIATIAEDGCLGRISADVGGRSDVARLDIGILQPTEDSWKTVGDRDVVCFLFPLGVASDSGSD